MIIHTLPSGDELHKYKKTLVLTFNGKRKTLSTSVINGGYRENMTAAFNNDCKPGAGMAPVLKAPTYEEHMKLLAEELGLDPTVTTGMSTAATMENVSIKSMSFRDISVTAIITGGIETNGGRVGDPATWHEENGKSVNTEVATGTINIMLFIDADLSEGAITRAVVTCTEAKSAAIAELIASSRYSMGIATGSGTDGTIIISNADSSAHLTQAGKHSKLGELIGVTVKAAVKETFLKQSNLCPETQHNVLRRIDRFGITEDILWESYTGDLDKPHFLHKLHTIAKENDMLTYTSLYIHLMDQLMWELISPEEAVTAGEMMISILEKRHSKPVNKISGDPINYMITAYGDFLTRYICDTNI
jgi:Uncharacterized conserved protein